jgi:hypothetical protein
MEKQEKVLKKIKNSLKHGNEGQLGVKKNDECYTDMQDILNELSQWAALDKFRGKNIICPCDWDIVNGENIYSITITYKEPGVEVVGNSVFKAVKSVYVDIWSDTEDHTVEHIALAEDEIEDFLRDKLTCNFIRTLTQNARAWGISSITASGYNPANGLGIKFQDVDYSKYDVCITNPPFSLYGEFMKAIVGKIDFIVLAPFLSRCHPCIGLPLMLNQAYLGFGVELHMNFVNPTKENNYSGTKVVNCDWITSFPEAQDTRNAKHFKSGIKYDLYRDEYEAMPNMTMKDGTHPIRVSMSTYPEDFDGWMFASMGVLDNLDQGAYEWYSTRCVKYFNSTNPEANPFAHKLSDEMYRRADGKIGFHGVIFRKKLTV